MRRRKAREPVTICSSPEAPLPTPFFTPQHPIASFRGHHEASQIGIRIFNAQPGYGVAFIRAAGLVHDYPRSASKFLLQEDVDRKVGLGWFGDSRRSNSIMSSMSSRDTQFWYQDLVRLCRKQLLQSHWLTCHSLWGKHAEVCSGVIVEDDMIWYDMIWYDTKTGALEIARYFCYVYAMPSGSGHLLGWDLCDVRYPSSGLFQPLWSVEHRCGLRASESLWLLGMAWAPAVAGHSTVPEKSPVRLKES